MTPTETPTNGDDELEHPSEGTRIVEPDPAAHETPPAEPEPDE